MVSSSGEESDEHILQHSRQVHNSAEANSAARAAAVCARRNIRLGFTDDSDDDLDTIVSASS